MKLHHLFAGLVLTSLVVVFLVIRAKSPEVVNEKLEYITPTQQSNVSQSQVEAALSNAAEAKFAVVFFPYDWSLTSVLSEREYFKFVDEFCKRYSNSPVLFHHVDLTDIKDATATVAEIPGWDSILGDSNAKRMFGQGDGLLVWLRNGRLVAMENAYELRNQDLSAKTIELFELEDLK